MAGAARRVAFITNAPLLESPQGLFSPLASVRREIILPARALSERGVNVHVISVPLWPADQVRSIVGKADRVVYGKLIRAAGESAASAYRADALAYRAVLAGTQDAQRNIFCFADDHFDAAGFARFYREVAPISRAWVASSAVLKERLEREASCPVLAYPEVTESAKGAPRTPRRRLRDRIAVWAARRARVGLEPWRMRLLWFGHPTNARSLLEVLGELRSLAEEIPLRLECVTAPGGPLDALSDSASGTLRITVTPWSLDYMPLAFEDCDAVILPQSVDDPHKRAKSNNRLVDALHAGRFVIAHPIPSYQALENYAWVGDSIAEGLRWLLRHPEEALRRLVAGQDHVAQHHSLDALADFWLRALDFCP
jgi:glycosyltransferase involved in cell wall biosynthesis